MSTITGKLSTIIGPAVEIGSIEVALCGYGPQVPRGTTTLFARITSAAIIPTSDGTFTFNVTGNDQIAPEGTYYTVIIKNSNGDIVQCDAYLFLDNQNYDLDSTNPFDPSQPIPPLPPLIINQLQILTDASSYVFDGSTYLSFKAVLNQPAFIDCTPLNEGNLYTFIIVQDVAGGHVPTWSNRFHNVSATNLKPNGITVQTFVCDEQGQLYSIAGATWWTP